MNLLLFLLPTLILSQCTETQNGTCFTHNPTNCIHLSSLQYSFCFDAINSDNQASEIVTALSSCPASGRPSAEFVCNWLSASYRCPTDGYAFAEGYEIISEFYCASACEDISPECMDIMVGFRPLDCAALGPCGVSSLVNCDEPAEGTCKVLDGLQNCQRFNGMLARSQCSSFNLRLMDARVGDLLDKLEFCTSQGRPGADYFCGQELDISYVCTENGYRTGPARDVISRYWCREKCQAIPTDCWEIIQNDTISAISCDSLPLCTEIPETESQTTGNNGDTTSSGDDDDVTNDNTNVSDDDDNTSDDDDNTVENTDENANDDDDSSPILITLNCLAAITLFL